MAQVLTIKIQLTTHDFDDIIGIFEDDKKFVEGTLDRCNIYQVKNMTGEALVQYLYGRRVPIARLYKISTTEWTTARPEKKIGWKHTDGKWYFQEKRGFEWTMKDLTKEDKDKLASEKTPQLDRLQILAKIKPTIAEYPENFTEVPKIVVEASIS